MDESYWQALLEDVDSELGAAAGSGAGANESLNGAGAPQGVEMPPGQDGDARANEEADWQRAEELLASAQPVEITVTGYNRGGLLAYFGSIPAFLPSSHLANAVVIQAPAARMGALATRVGDRLEVRVIEIDRERRRLILSERCAQASGSAQSLLATLQPGQTVRGQVTNLCAFGAFVDLGGFEGLIHISELSWGRVNLPAEVVKPGDDVDVMVLGVNCKAQKVALSLKRLRPDPWQGLEDRYHVGQVVEAVITNVVNFGAFARLEEGLEGLVHISELSEGTFMHPRNIVNEGDRVRVRVLHVDGAKHRLALTMRCSDPATRARPAYLSDEEWPG
jgi:small subunit ribosomal protein S1